MNKVKDVALVLIILSTFVINLPVIAFAAIGATVILTIDIANDLTAVRLE